MVFMINEEIQIVNLVEDDLVSVSLSQIFMYLDSLNGTTIQYFLIVTHNSPKPLFFVDYGVII